MNNDSLKKRYLYKLVANIIGTLIAIITNAIVPRALGVKHFGDFNFVTTFFKQLIDFLDFRSSTYFYITLSQNQKDNVFMSFYAYFSLIIFSCLTFFTLLISNLPLKNLFLPGQTTIIIYYSLLFVVINWLLDLFIKIMDAKGKTVYSEKWLLVNKLIGAFFIVLLYFIDRLNLISYFITLLISAVFIMMFFYNHLKKDEFKLTIFKKKDIPLIRHHSKKMMAYSAPLGFYVCISFFTLTFDRWMLQKSGGSYQQGLFSFGFMITNFCFLFTQSMLPLFTRELSVAAGENNINKMSTLYRQFVPLLYAITAYFCCFIFIEADTLIIIFGGEEYYEAKNVMVILAFYPLVSVYSNLNGSVIYANSRTKFVLKLAILFAPIGVLITYFLVSNSNFAINLGAEGLSYKMLFLELISVLIILKINTKFLNLVYWRYVVHMIFSVIPFLVIAYFSHNIVNSFTTYFTDYSNLYVKFISSGILYTLLMSVIIIFFPLIMGLNRQDIKSVFQNLGIKS
jgi:O-antigen/teichoic acid export membrane protein